jgi:HSP20 family protein
MRYRRMQYRYAMVMAAERPRPIESNWRDGGPAVTLAQPCWRPLADVYETSDAVVVTVDLAGANTEDIDVLLFEDAVVVEGQRRLPVDETGGMYHTAEIRQGPFRLDVALPAAIEPEQAEAAYGRGLLQLRLTKSKGEADGR